MIEPDGAAGPMPFNRILDETLRWARQYIGAVFLPVAVPVALISGLIPLAQGFLFQGMLRQEGEPDPTSLIGGGVGFAAAMVLMMASQYVGYAAMMAAACEAVAGRGVSMARAVRFPFRPRVLGISFVIFVGVVAGAFCCVLPGIYLAMLWGMTLPVLFLESTSGFGALRRSADLMRYNPSGRFTTDPRVKLFALTFTGYMLAYAVSFVIQLPVMVLQQVLMFRSMPAGGEPDPQAFARLFWLQVPATVLGTAVQMLMQLYICFGVVLLYFDLRRRREGMDLEAAIAELPGAVLAPEGSGARP